MSLRFGLAGRKRAQGASITRTRLKGGGGGQGMENRTKRSWLVGRLDASQKIGGFGGRSERQGGYSRAEENFDGGESQAESM